jgi:iron complex outermembrane receptor protein
MPKPAAASQGAQFARPCFFVRRIPARLSLKPLPVALCLAFGGAAFAQEASTAAKPADQTLPAIEVRAAEENTQHLQRPVSSGALGSRSQLDTPFSTTVVSGEDLADRQVTKLGDVFANEASASDNSNAYNAWASYLTVRGMQLDWQNGFRIDGLPFVSYGITLPYDHFEQIELLKGLSGFMYGFVTPGGMVNYVTKKPTSTPIRHIDVGLRSDSVWTQHVDLGGRFGTDDRFGYRVNYTHEDGKLYSGTQIKRDSFSLALDAKITDALTWHFNGLYQDRESTGQSPSFYTGSYTSSSLPAPISGSRKDLQGQDQHLNTTLQHYSTGLKYQLNSDWSLNADYSYSAVTRTRNEGTYYLLNSAGAYSEARYDGAQGHRYSQLQATAQGRFRTGAFAHQLVLGTAWMQQINDYSSNDVFLTIGTGNLYSANTNSYYSTTGFKLFRDSDITQQAVFASDTIQLSERWSVLAGVRHTNYEQKSYNAAGTTLSTYNKNTVTPTLALMFKPEPTTTVYGSYVEALEPGSQVGVTYANSGAQLKPLLSKQYEAGVKTDRDSWSATAALFQIQRGAEYANSANVLVQDGESIFQGLELAAAWRPSRQWELSGSLMALDSYYSKGTSYNGNRVAGAPDFVATGRLSYNVPGVSGLKLFTDAKYTGKTAVRAAGGLDAPDYTVMNIGASYATRISGYGVTFRAAVNNVLDKKYWMFQYANYVRPGDPRSVSLNAAVDF